ncbi:MAG: hypothetical protein U5R48_18950 [Gammaproteobacteria bacterium]|nr:hypothetical protein [Gammaproteobacteria bacterium]
MLSTYFAWGYPKLAKRWGRIGLGAGLIIAVLLGSATYHGIFRLQTRIIDEIVARAAPTDLRNASLLQVLRVGVLSGALQDPRFPYQGRLEDKLDLMQLFLILQMDRAVIERVAGTAEEAIYRIMSCTSYREHFNEMQAGYETFLASYNDYADASDRVQEKRVEISRRIIARYQELMARIPDATRTRDRRLQIERFNSRGTRSSGARIPRPQVPAEPDGIWSSAP